MELEAYSLVFRTKVIFGYLKSSLMLGFLLRVGINLYDLLNPDR